MSFSSRPTSPLPYSPVEGVAEPVTAEAFLSLAAEIQGSTTPAEPVVELIKFTASISAFLAKSDPTVEKFVKLTERIASHKRYQRDDQVETKKKEEEKKESKEEVSLVRTTTNTTSDSRNSKKNRTSTTTAIGSSSSSSSSVGRRALPPVPRVPFPPVPQAPISRVEPALVFMPDTAPGSLLGGILPLPALPEAPDAHPIPVGTPTLISVPDTSPQPVSRPEATPDVSSISSGSSASSASVAFSSYPQSPYPMSSPGSATPSEHKAFPADLASTLVVQDILARWSAIQGLPSSIGVFGGSASTSSASTAQPPHGSSSSLSSLLVRRPGETS